MTVCPHTIKEIDFTNLDNAKIYSISKGLYCGRRFRINDSQDYVIFNDLFRKAKKLARHAYTLEELTNLKAFIGELRKVEKIANTDYQKKDCLYKFISWFHRLFGGAFFGSHLKRLDILDRKVDSMVLKAELKSFLQQTLSKDDLPILKQYLQGSASRSFFWKEGTLTINYTTKNEMVFTTFENKTLCIDFQNDFTLSGDIAELEELRKVISDLFIRVFSPRATYIIDYPPKITVVKEEIGKIPVWHLFRFSQIVSGDALIVNFLDSGLVPEEGVDHGGLRRDYATILIGKIINLTHFFCFDNGNLALPRIKGSMTSKASQLYYALGMALRICYESEELISGCYFNHTLFNAAKILTTDQIGLSFDSVPKEIRGKMAQEVIKELDKALSTCNVRLFKSLELLDKVKLQADLDHEEPENLYNAIYAARIDYLTEDLTEVNFDKIRANTSQFIDELYESLMNNPLLVTELNGTSLNSIIEPVHCIAQGLRAGNWLYSSNWPLLQNDPDLIPKIQGVMDRNIIVDAITQDDERVPDIKINWLKDWIKDEASEVELRSFLRYVTGAVGLPAGAKISIELGGLPDLAVHTCYYGLEICPDIGEEFLDGTKESFIENLKGAIQNTRFQMD